MKLINEVKDHTDDEIVDFNEIDLQREFTKLNKLLFNDSLYPVEMLWNTHKAAHGVVKATRNRLTGEIKIKSLGMSRFYEIKYKDFKDTLAHEMIHVYWLQKEINCHHDWRFIQQMNRINSMGLGFNVSVKKDSSNLGISNEISEKKVQYVICIINMDGADFLATMTNNAYQNEASLIGNIFKYAVKKGKYKKITGMFYKSSDPLLRKEKIQRTFKSSISYSKLLPERKKVLEDNSDGFLNGFEAVGDDIKWF